MRPSGSRRGAALLSLVLLTLAVSPSAGADQLVDLPPQIDEHVAIIKNDAYLMAHSYYRGLAIGRGDYGEN